MGKTELNLTDLKLQVLGQFSSLSGSFKELPKFVIPLLLDLSEFFETQKNLSSEDDLKKIKIKAVEMKNDDENESNKDQSFKEEQTPLETAFEKLLSSNLKGLLQKALLLKAQKRLLKKEGQSKSDLEKEVAGVSTSTTQEKPAQTFTPKSSVRKITPFLAMQKQSDLYEKIFSPVSDSIAATEESLLELFSQPVFSSILAKRFLKKKSSKEEKDQPKKEEKENQDELSF